jgi:hypothetical protein
VARCCAAQASPRATSQVTLDARRHMVQPGPVAARVRAACSGNQPPWADLSEMLPGPDGCWLTDRHGARYACELRLVVTEHRDP